MTPKDLELVALVRQGKTNKEIINIMNIKYQVLLNRLSSIYRMYGYKNKQSLLLDVKDRR